MIVLVAVSKVAIPPVIAASLNVTVITASFVVLCAVAFPVKESTVLVLLSRVKTAAKPAGTPVIV
ncbi:hypothetical protein D3C80_1570610 [compost metagenome]